MSPDLADYSGRTPLHLAVVFGHLEVVRLLLEPKEYGTAVAPMDPNVKDASGARAPPSPPSPPP